MKYLLLVTAALMLSGCYEPASKWDSKRGRFVSTEQLDQERRQEIKDIDRRLDRLEGVK